MKFIDSAYNKISLYKYNITLMDKDYEDYDYVKN